jgi:DNA-binding XRE family transcriptional regulator
VRKPKAPASRPDNSRLAIVKLPREMPGGKTSTSHPLVWLMKDRLDEPHNESGKPNKSDLARYLGVRPQSLYKWERLCRGDRNYPLPPVRAAQLASFFNVKPSLFRPDVFKVS